MGLTNICCLDHADIVPTISNAAHSFLSMLTDQSSNIGLLSRRTTAGDDGGKFGGNFDKLILEEIQT
jgi:hypothetical protein